VRFADNLRLEIPSFPQRTGLGPVRKSYRSVGLGHGISIGIREKYIKIGNKFDCVEGVRDCARGCTNRGQSRSMMSAKDVTPITLFERLYLVLGMDTFEPCVNCPYLHTTPTVHFTTISRFLYNFFPLMTHDFFVHDSPSNLAESRYPHWRCKIYGQSHLRCHFRILFQRSNLKSRTSLFH